MPARRRGAGHRMAASPYWSDLGRTAAARPSPAADHYTPVAAAGADPGAGPNVQGQEDVPIPRWMRDRDRTWLRYASERDGSRPPWSPCPRARPPGATGMRGRTHEEEDHCQTPRPPPEAQRHAVLRRHPGQPRHHLCRLRQRLPNQIVTVVGDKGAVCVLNFPH
jgi:hypothetical protein